MLCRNRTVRYVSTVCRRRIINGTIQEAPEDQQNDDNIPDYDNLEDDDEYDEDDGEIQYRDGPGWLDSSISCLFSIVMAQVGWTRVSHVYSVS